MLCQNIQMYRILFLLAGLVVVTGCVPVTTTYYPTAPIVTTGYVAPTTYYYSQPYYRSYYRNNYYRNHNHSNYHRYRNHRNYR